MVPGFPARIQLCRRSGRRQCWLRHSQCRLLRLCRSNWIRHSPFAPTQCGPGVHRPGAFRLPPAIPPASTECHRKLRPEPSPRRRCRFLRRRPSRSGSRAQCSWKLEVSFPLDNRCLVRVVPRLWNRLRRWSGKQPREPVVVRLLSFSTARERQKNVPRMARRRVGGDLYTSRSAMSIV